MYKIRLDIHIIEPKKFESIAETSVLRTSLIRKDRKLMTREAFAELFFDDTEKEAYISSDVRFNGSDKVQSVHLSIDDESRKYAETITDFFENSPLEYTFSELKYPPEGVDVIATVYGLRGKKYLQFREKKSDKLIAEVFIENVHDEEKKDFKKPLEKRLNTLINAFKNEMGKIPPYFLK